MTVDVVADRRGRLAAKPGRAKLQTWPKEARPAIDAEPIELRRLRDELTLQGNLLERCGAAKVTRKQASTVPGLRPNGHTGDANA